MYGFTSKKCANHWHEICWPVELSLAAEEDFPPTQFVIFSSGHVSYIQAPFLLSCGKDSRGWTSLSIALLCLHDRVRHCRTTVTVRSVRNTCSSENIHIYRPDVTLCRSELNSVTVSPTPVRWKCSENKKYSLLVVTQARWPHLMDIAYRLKNAIFWEITPFWLVFCYGRFEVLDASIFTQSLEHKSPSLPVRRSAFDERFWKL